MEGKDRRRLGRFNYESWNEQKATNLTHQKDTF